MSEAIASIKEAKLTQKLEQNVDKYRHANSYPVAVVEKALQTARSNDEPGLFDRASYVQAVASGSRDIDQFGGPFSEIYEKSDLDLEIEELDPIHDVIEEITRPEYVYKGRARSRLRSGPYPIKSEEDEDLINRYVFESHLTFF